MKKSDVTLTNCGHLVAQVWSATEYGFIIYNSAGTQGVQVVFNRSTKAVNVWPVG